jgi:fibronectin type 3 domain-containing protein
MVYANVRRFSVTALILTMFLYVIAPALSIETRAHADTAGLTLKFDFGTQTSPVAAGFNRVHESLLYSPSLGYGLDRAVVSRLRTGGDDLTNDFVLGTDYKFMADVPNGQYDVTVYSGDLLAGTSTTKTTVTLGGQTAGTIQSRQSVTSATYRTTVTGGQLVVGITGVGAGGYLNGLVIQQVLQAPPAPPAALSVTNIDPTAASPSVSLQWSSVTDAVYYHVYRAAGGSDAYQVIAETTATNYKDSGVAAGSSYSYKISALNASRQESALSQAVTADVKADPQLPAEPLPQSFPLKLDFGPGPAADGYLKVGATAYSPDLKYGFSDPAQVACFDRGTSDPLKSDFCAPAAGTSFNLDLPNGDYTITVTAGDEMSATDVAITAESIVKLPETSKSAGSYVEQSFDIALVDGQLNLTFTGTSPKINAIVVTKLPDRTPGDQPTVYIAGDSTVQTYDPYWRPQAGWGQMLPRFFDNQVLFNNKAIGGRSSKTFITEGRLDDILRQIRPNDYFFIQFGHNDATISIPERLSSGPASVERRLCWSHRWAAAALIRIPASSMSASPTTFKG